MKPTVPETVTGKKTELDGPPPGPGFITVTEPVPRAATSAAVILALSCELFTKAVLRSNPFRWTDAPVTNPVPLTVSVNPAPPATALDGIKG
jgi:hypothetical protein